MTHSKINFKAGFQRFIIASTMLWLLLNTLQNEAARAQTIHTTVQVDRSQIESTSLHYLDHFANELETYLNDYSWSDDTFQPQEKIEVLMQITLQKQINDYTFSADLVVRSTRPIYNSNRHTTVFVFNDKNWTFEYVPNRSFVHNYLQFDAITTLMDFYANIILGYDYDTFSSLGGTPYFAEAMQQVSLAQTTSLAGWQRSSNMPGSRARLIADLLNPAYEQFRLASYTYHRLGLDLFLKNPQEARQHMIQALQMIQTAKRQTTGNLLFDIFFNAKYREITAAFEDASAKVRSRVYKLLVHLDPIHLNEYRKLQ